MWYYITFKSKYFFHRSRFSLLQLAQCPITFRYSLNHLDFLIIHWIFNYDRSLLYMHAFISCL
ncbi:hypothetical protein CW304_29260 [Bacillus sp. UFRGS-B20]|nr:hypothetical protein CW304_29260 [Bacillus sp. UFRGS-B20]